jgi:hypothetical protein
LLRCPLASEKSADGSSDPVRATLSCSRPCRSPVLIGGLVPASSPDGRKPVYGVATMLPERAAAVTGPLLRENTRICGGPASVPLRLGWRQERAFAWTILEPCSKSRLPFSGRPARVG